MGRQNKTRLDEMTVQLLAIIAVRGLPQTHQIATLNRIGFTPKEIAQIVGTTPNTVRVSLVGIRKAEQGGKRPMRFRREEDSNE